MTIDEQLREFARRADQHQQPITASEIVQRASSGPRRSFLMRQESTNGSTSAGDMSMTFIDEEAIVIDLDSEPSTEPRRKRRVALPAAGLAAAAAAGAIALVVMPSNDVESPADQPSTIAPVPAPKPMPTGDASLEPGTYRVPEAAWSVADFEVSFPEGWTVADGNRYGATTSDGEEFGLFPIVVDEVYADACEGTRGSRTEFGPSVDDLAAALLQQSGTIKRDPVDTALGGYPAIRIDLTAPDGPSLEACNLFEDGLLGLQILFRRPDDYFVLPPDAVASVYVVDVNGERQVFVTQRPATASAEDLAELQTVLDSIRIGAPTPELGEPSATASADDQGSIPAGDAPLEPGDYRVPSSAWSVADFEVTFPAAWAVQYGHVYGRRTAQDDEIGFYAVVVDEIYADPCAGSNTGEVIAVGPSVDDLVAGLLEQPGPLKSDPVDTTFGGYPATRVDLTVPDGFDLDACNVAGMGLQLWYSAPADKYFVLLDDATASVYVVDVDGERQVFVTQYGANTSDADRAELQAVLDSIRIG